MTKNKIHYLAILYKRGSVKNFFQKTNTPPQNNKTKKEKLNSDNPTQTVGFHLQGLQTAAFVLASVSDMLDVHQVSHALQPSL